VCEGSPYRHLLPGVRKCVSMEVSFIEDSLGEAEYNIPLCVANKSIAIILIPNKYHEFRVWYKFVCINFIGKIHICSTTKDMEVQYFRFFTCEDLLRCFLFELFNRSMIIDIGSSYKSKLPLGIR